MKFSLCNEVLAAWPLARQCEYAASLGYDGLEIAPYTLSGEPQTLSSPQAADIRKTVESFGLVVTGLHWLLVKPDGLSLTHPNADVRNRTFDVMTRLTSLCAELGGAVLVHGSPRQRQIAPGDSHETALARLADALQRIAEVAGAHGVTYCIEPLAPRETPLINSVSEAAAIVEAINRPGLRTMIDCSAAGTSETMDVPALIAHWMPTGVLAHIQVNDPNRRGPGQGEMAFGPILKALQQSQYRGVVAVEPFEYEPDGPGCAAFSIGYLKGLLQALDHADAFAAQRPMATSR